MEQVDSVQRAAGYRIIGWVAGDDAPALAVAGFRTGENFARGRYLYIDDLSTLPDARQRGYARSLLHWIHQEARRLECDQIHVDSRVEVERLDAHRLYLNAGYRISSYHFARTV